ncbi:MAG: tRNA pseudouridine(38-40) synthase TruA [Flavobacteriaceae bacterium]
MKENNHQYLIKVQYLGFRYSGWQKQPGQKTLESMILKTLKFVCSPAKVKILGAGRTDAKVSAQLGFFELFTDTAIPDIAAFLERFNANLPPDIKILGCSIIGKEFNVIQDVAEKEYQYFFSYGDKNHPYCAPFMANILCDLDIDKMTVAAKYYEGTHYFRSYTTRTKQSSDYQRTLTECSLKPNKILTANFFPQKSYVLTVRGKGFMRYQIRMIMGTLIQVGKGEMELEEIMASLQRDSKLSLTAVAPGSGLHLTDLKYSAPYDNV